MASWSEFESVAPELAARVRAIFAARKHHTLATVRRDGSPRVSGIEVEFRADGQLVLGMMAGSKKADDVMRDGRIAVQGLSDDPPETDQASWPGDARIGGIAALLTPRLEDHPPGPRFGIEIHEVVHTHLNDAADTLVIESWHTGRGLQTQGRR
jgi:Pyridoxamine 5'-phosphate oxidase